MEGDVITLQDLFLFDFGAGIDEDGKFRGRLKSTGLRPEVRRQAGRAGASRSRPEVFAPDGGSRTTDLFGNDASG